MIRAIITDVDGVIVGKTPGFNFPIPNDKVLDKLKEIREKDFPVILCTAKSLFPNLPTVEKAHLDNLHIFDGGALITNPIAKKVIDHQLSKEIVEKIIYFCLENNIYIEIFAPDTYFVEESQVGLFTKQHSSVMQQNPKIVKSLLEIITKASIIKILLIVPGPEDMNDINEFLGGIQNDITYIWTMHPTMLPAQATVITKSGVSKKHGAEEVIKELGISFEAVLGIGDTKGDWAFMQLCGYNAVIGDDADLKDLVERKGEGKYFFAPSVEENGILQVFDFFKI